MRTILGIRSHLPAEAVQLEQQAERHADRDEQRGAEGDDGEGDVLAAFNLFLDSQPALAPAPPGQSSFTLT